MKLLNSVQPLLNMLDDTTFAQINIKQGMQMSYRDIVANPKIKDSYKALRYRIWQSLTPLQRDQVISHSDLPFIGGYYDYNDNNLDALLRKALPTTKLIVMLT